MALLRSAIEEMLTPTSLFEIIYCCSIVKVDAFKRCLSRAACSKEHEAPKARRNPETS